MSEVKLLFDVPKQDEVGFVGFMDDVLTIGNAFKNEDMATAWPALRRLVIERLDDPSILDNDAFFRAQTLEGLKNIFTALTNAITPPKV